MAAVEGLIDGPFAAALARRREWYNARFAAARALGREVDASAFRRVLIELVDPCVRAVAAADQTRIDPAAQALYELALDLVAREHLGPAPRQPSLNDSWKQLLPAAGRFLAQDPARVAAAVTNAVHNIAQQPRARPAEWIRIMLAAAPLCRDVDVFFATGRVAAWRAGMAHHREGALRVWRDLPPALQLVTLGLENDGASTENLARALVHPWRHPESVRKGGQAALALVAATGGFRGFDGPFMTPPAVVAMDGFLYVSDDEDTYTLHADCFGTVFLRFGKTPPHAAGGGDPAFDLSSEGVVSCGDRTRKFRELAGSSSHASTGSTLAVTLPRSHRVYLVAEAVL